MINVTHIITGLAPQGAETMLYKLIFQMDPSAFTNEVISLTNWHEAYPDWKPMGKRLEPPGWRCEHWECVEEF